MTDTCPVAKNLKMQLSTAKEGQVSCFAIGRWKKMMTGPDQARTTRLIQRLHFLTCATHDVECSKTLIPKICATHDVQPRSIPRLQRPMPPMPPTTSRPRLWSIPRLWGPTPPMMMWPRSPRSWPPRLTSKTANHDNAEKIQDWQGKASKGQEWHCQGLWAWVEVEGSQRVHQAQD